jgi:hypothetical protein
MQKRGGCSPIAFILLLLLLGCDRYATTPLLVLSPRLDAIDGIPAKFVVTLANQGSVALTIDNIETWTPDSGNPAMTLNTKPRQPTRRGESGRDDGIAPVTPPTPPGMRVRTRRFQPDSEVEIYPFLIVQFGPESGSNGAAPCFHPRRAETVSRFPSAVSGGS